MTPHRTSMSVFKAYSGYKNYTTNIVLHKLFNISANWATKMQYFTSKKKMHNKDLQTKWDSKLKGFTAVSSYKARI